MNSSASNPLDLNYRFYGAPPTDYFHQRLTSLVLAYKRPERLDLEEGETIQIGVARLTSKPDDDEDVERRKRFVTTEAQVLLHHIVETILRLYFAHKPVSDRHIPPYPWIEIAKVTSFSKFKSMVRKEFIESTNENRRRELLNVTFFGHESLETITVDLDEDTWTRATTNLDRLMRIYADIFLEQAHLYNSAKHGLAVNAGTATVEFGSEGEDPVFRTEGESISYLERIPDEKKQRHWHQTTEWVDTERAIVLSYAACGLIESLWSVARNRYLGEKGLNVKIPMMASLGELDLYSGGSSEAINGIVVRKMSIPL